MNQERLLRSPEGRLGERQRLHPLRAPRRPGPAALWRGPGRERGRGGGGAPAAPLSRAPEEGTVLPCGQRGGGEDPWPHEKTPSPGAEGVALTPLSLDTLGAGHGVAVRASGT